jgi:glutamate-1-semialdehyde 2,1-aminomutase
VGIVDDYVALTKGSKERWTRMREVLPDGHTRSVAFFKPYPLVLQRGKGSRVWDADGNEYIDLVNNYTALVHGHAHPELALVASKATEEGTVFPAPHLAQEEHARILVARLLGAEQVRYTNSGTEAAMLAVRIARAVTGRDIVAKAKWGYHGTFDGLWAYVEEGEALGNPIEPQPGIPEAVHDLTKVFEYNDVADLQSVCRGIGDGLAAIIVEPVLGSGGAIAASPEFLRACRLLCDELGAVLILDEVQTFRLEVGGLQGRWRVQPDLTVLGKFIGGGYPIGAVVGRHDLMDVFCKGHPHYVNHSGTFNGNVVSMTCGVASLRLLSEEAIRQINAYGTRMAEAVNGMVSKAGLTGCVTGYGSIFNVHLGIAEARLGADVVAEDGDALQLLHLALILEGVFASPRGMMNISTAFSDDDVDTALARIERAIARVKDEI